MYVPFCQQKIRSAADFDCQTQAEHCAICAELQRAVKRIQAFCRTFCEDSEDFAIALVLYRNHVECLAAHHLKCAVRKIRDVGINSVRRLWQSNADSGDHIMENRAGGREDLSVLGEATLLFTSIASRHVTSGVMVIGVLSSRSAILFLVHQALIRARGVV